MTNHKWGSILKIEDTGYESEFHRNQCTPNTWDVTYKCTRCSLFKVFHRRTDGRLEMHDTERLDCDEEIIRQIHDL